MESPWLIHLYIYIYVSASYCSPRLNIDVPQCACHFAPQIVFPWFRQVLSLSNPLPATSHSQFIIPPGRRAPYTTFAENTSAVMTHDTYIITYVPDLPPSAFTVSHHLMTHKIYLIFFSAGIFTKPSSIQRNAFNESSTSATYQNRRLKAVIVEPIRADSYSAWRAC